MEVAINNNIYQQAQDYAQKQGLSLATLIEEFLMRYIRLNKTDDGQPVPDVVLSLLGAGEPIDDDDINGRKAYYQFLEEKYK